MANADYGITVQLKGIDLQAAYDKVVAALKEQGFGVLTEIDVKKTLKEKLGVDFRKYLILGACNPPLAHRSLQAEPLIGLLLPCNVVLFENDDGSVTVSAVDPEKMFEVVGNPDVAPIAKEVKGKLTKALESLSS